MSSGVYETKSNIGVHLYPTTICSAVKMMKYQNIAPSTGSENKTRKYTTRDTSAPYNMDQKHSVQRRNARERNRVKQVNNSFAKLRQHIPQSIISDLTKGGGRGPQKKVSKVDTLRIAVEYIRRLQDLVDELNSNCGNSSASDTVSNSSFCSTSSATLSPPPHATHEQQHFSSVSSPLPGYMEEHHNHNQNQTQQPTTVLTPITLNTFANTQTHLDNACHSPTSSFNSSMSFDSGTFESTTQLSPQTATPTIDAHLQLKFEPYDNFNLNEEDCTPDDEEILDYISLWQQQ